jgi:hypothetical protein
MHVHGFRFALSDGAIGDAGDTGVVHLYGGGWLRPARFFKDVAEHCTIFSIVEKACRFSFSCG